MKNSSTSLFQSTYVAKKGESCRIRALMNMGTALNEPLYAMRSAVSALTPAEMEICVLHFADGRSQALVARWLNVSLRHVQRTVASAVEKVPQLQPLCAKSRFKPKRPHLLQLSQLKNFTGREMFNIDEL